MNEQLEVSFSFWEVRSVQYYIYSKWDADTDKMLFLFWKRKYFNTTSLINFK